MLEIFTNNDINEYARFVLSGYIILTVRNAYISTRRPALAEIVIDVVLFSLINRIVFLILGVAVRWLQQIAVDASPRPEHFTGNPFSPNALLAIETLLLPVILGILFGRLLQGPLRGKLITQLGLPTTGPTERAYDHVFSTLKDPCFVIITLEDDSVIGGYFGNASHAGRDSERAEIFLEETFILNGDDQWKSYTPKRSAMIRLAKLKSIEFLADPEPEPKEERKD